MKSVQRIITVNNRNGVHSRVATKLAGIADNYNLTFAIVNGDEIIDCSSVLDVLGMSLAYGSSFTLKISGEEPEKAIPEVKKLFNCEK